MEGHVMRNPEDDARRAEIRAWLHGTNVRLVTVDYELNEDPGGHEETLVDGDGYHAGPEYEDGTLGSLDDLLEFAKDWHLNPDLERPPFDWPSDGRPCPTCGKPCDRPDGGHATPEVWRR